MLLLKSYLQFKGLKDVYTGGLGSFSLTIMLVFYLEVSFLFASALDIFLHPSAFFCICCHALDSCFGGETVRAGVA